MNQKNETLKDKILKEMTVDHSNALEKNFELAKRFINITPEGKVDVKISKDKLQNNDLILLYLAGKLYAKEAGTTETELTSNDELKNELGLASGSVLWSTKNLRDNHLIKTSGGKHTILINRLEKALNDIDKKLGNSQ